MGYDTRKLINYLDLVSLATVADQVPLYDENRIITYLGLEQINKNLAQDKDLYQILKEMRFPLRH